MPIAESTTVKLTWTIYLLSWITIPIYGVEILILFTLYYVASMGLDIVWWYLAARLRKKVLSKTFIEWILLKWFILCFILLLVFISIAVTKVLWDYKVILFWYNLHVAACVWLIPHMFIILFSFWENISFIEKLSIIYKWTKQWTIFNILNFLSNKLYNSSLDYLQDNIEKKIDNKFNNNLQK